MLPEGIKDRLADFAKFARSLHGDEKSEAQAFLERLFRAFGHAGVIEAGATFEFRVAKKPGTAQLELLKGEAARTGSGKKFADLLWPERVLIEMKSRGAKLERHYDQAFEYWQLIVPNRPRYVILCNFDEFWIYDFKQQLFDPVERVTLRHLPESSASFGFLFPAKREPIFGNNRVEVTRKAGERNLRGRRFVRSLQMLLAKCDHMPPEIPKSRFGCLDAIEGAREFAVEGLLGDITPCIKRIKCVCKTIVKRGQARDLVCDPLL